VTAKFLLQNIRTHQTDFTPAGTKAVVSALRQASQCRMPDAETLIELHELLLFLRAYPASLDILRLSEALLGVFHKRVADLEKSDVDLAPLEGTEVSGISGSSLVTYYSYPMACYLAERFRRQIRIAWECWDEANRLGHVLPDAVPFLAEDAKVEPHPDYRRWVETVSGGGNKELPWLLKHCGGKDKFDLLGLPVEWKFGNNSRNRTRMRLPGGKIFFHTTPLIQRREIDLGSITSAPPFPVRKLTLAEGERMLALGREALGVRYRELYGLLWGDPRHVVEIKVGRGVRFFFSSVLPGHRLPLRSYLGATLWKNGVPIGYFEGLALFDRMEAGFNLFYTFRAGETAWIYQQLLTCCHQLAGARCFLLDPYQIGHENEEGIKSGAFWFYRKLGYRSVDPQLRTVTLREEKRMKESVNYRTSKAILKRLATKPVVFDAPGSDAGAWDRFQLNRLGLAAARVADREFDGDTARMRERSMATVARAAGFSTKMWRDSELRVFSEIAPLLSIIPSLSQWSAKEHHLLEKIIRSKADGDELRHLRLTQRHPRLRAAFLSLGNSRQ
jgi:hypothetical protein